MFLLLDLNASRTRDLLTANPSLCHRSVDFKDVKATAQCLKERNYTNQEIILRPTVLLVNRITALNRLKVLEECSFRQFKLVFICRFVSVLNKDINHLKAFNYIDRNANVPQSIASFLDVPINLTEEINDNVKLKMAREVIINIYLKEKLGMTNQDIIKLWKVYGRLRHKSIESIVENVNLLLHKIGFSKERIKNNMFLLYACADNITQMIADIPSIDGTPMESILINRPKIAMQNAESVKSSVGHIKSFDIPESRYIF